MLLAAVAQQHCHNVDLGIVRDDEEDIDQILQTVSFSGIDILLTSGGVSMGDKDFIKPLLKKRGKVHFDKVYFMVPFASFCLLSLYLILSIAWELLCSHCSLNLLDVLDCWVPINPLRCNLSVA